jgi:hypothetical protein
VIGVEADRLIQPREAEMIANPAVEKAALRCRPSHVRHQLFRHVMIAVTLAADELDVQPVIGSIIVEAADDGGRHGSYNPRVRTDVS